MKNGKWYKKMIDLTNYSYKKVKFSFKVVLNGRGSITIDNIKLANKTALNITELLPKKTKLYQNYPNPFNPITNIKFDLARESRVELNVYNIKGELVKQLYNQKLKAGFYQKNFDANNLSSGLYFYELKVNNKVFQNKMILCK